MTENTHGPQAFQFGVFELNLKAGELRKQGAKIKLQEQPLQVLRLLLEHAGDVVTKEELQQRIWPSDTFVDFDHGLHSAMTRLREALGDSSDGPRFIETLARRGYRFIAPVTVIGASTEPGSAAGHKGLASAGGLRRFSGSMVAGLLGGALLLAGSLSFDIGGAQRWLRRQSNPPVHSLAVLPLQNLSGDSAQDYFADGMTEALITDLGKLGSLRVISRTSAMHYKGTRKTLPEIARELNVDAIVEGGVLRSGNRVRITAQLVEAASDRHLWAESYERDLRDTLVLQGEVARAVANQVRIKLSPEEQARYTQARPVNPEALEAYLQGRYEWNKWTEEGLKKGIEYFEQAIQKDPAYAQAWAGLSEAYSVGGLFVPVQSQWHSEQDLAKAKAKAAALKALELDETLSEAHVSLGYALIDTDWSWGAAEKEFKRAIALDANNAGAHRAYGADYLMAMGRLDEAVAEMKRALELDPLFALNHYLLARALSAAGRYEEALREYDEAVALGGGPRIYATHRRVAIAYERTGREREAITELVAALRAVNENRSLRAEDLAALVERKYASFGYSEAKRVFLRGDALHVAPKLGPIWMVLDYAELGEMDKAFEQLDKAIQQRNSNMRYIKVDERLVLLRSDPRFQDLVRSIGLPP